MSHAASLHQQFSLYCQCTSTDIFLKYPVGSYTGDLDPGRRYNTVAFCTARTNFLPHFLPFLLFIYFFFLSRKVVDVTNFYWTRH